MQNTKKWIMMSYIFLAALTWVFFYYLTDSLWDALSLPVYPDLFLSPAHMVASVTGIALLLVLQRSEKVNTFASEVASELAKVTWPERKETLLSAGVISIMIAICAMILFAYDSILGTFIKVLY